MLQLMTASDAATQAHQTIHFLQRLNWESLTDQFINRVIQLVVITVVFILLQRVGKYVIRRSFRHYKARLGVHNRADTMAALTLNTYGYVIAFFYAYSFLTIIGIPIGTLIAGAGIVGLAIGFGAQGFVSDLVNGFFIIMEGQLDVGDSVTLSTVSGTVRAVGLRTTQVESSDGTLNYIPNRNITIVSNASRNAMKITVSLPLANAGDTPQVETIIKEVNDREVANTPGLAAEPQLLGLSENKWGALTYQVLLTTRPGQQLAMQRQFLTSYVDALSQAGIDLRTGSLPQQN